MSSFLINTERALAEDTRGAGVLEFRSPEVDLLVLFSVRNRNSDGGFQVEQVCLKEDKDILRLRKK
jgi:hypothetical protein